MVSQKAVFWDVDTEYDFMLPDGKLYVPGAEKLIANLRRLVDAAREGRVFLISNADRHTLHDEEFKQWPPHCLQGTRGAELVPETLTDKCYVIPNRPAPLPKELGNYKQVLLEKQALDVFTNPNTEPLLQQLKSLTGPNPEFVVFGVATEYCVRCVARGLLDRGKRVALVTDAIETLNPADGRRTLAELTARGARLISTEQALELVKAPAATAA